MRVSNQQLVTFSLMLLLAATRDKFQEAVMVKTFFWDDYCVVAENDDYLAILPLCL